MAVAVQGPRERREKADPLDTILKGLGIAAGVYNIYSKNADEAKNKLAMERQDALNQERLAQDKITQKSVLLSRGQKLDESGGVVEDPQSLFAKKTQEDIKKGNEELALKKEALALQRMQNSLLKSSNAFKQMPEDQKIMVEKFSAEKAKLFPIVNQFDQYIAQMEDPNLSDNQKQQIGLQSLKLMNSPNNPDAVGAEEVKRIGSFLTAAPQPFGPKGFKIGVDLNGFTQALRNTRDRANMNLQSVTNQIDTLMGRVQPTPAQVPQQGKAQTKQAQNQGSNILQNRAQAAQGKPDFSKMTTEELLKYTGGK